MKIGASGQLHLNFSHHNQTKLRTKKQTPPLRVIRAFSHQGDTALVHLHNVSGGVLGGDQFDIQIDLDPYALAMATTTGSTRIYRHRDGYETATQKVSINLGEQSRFEFIPDSTIPFARSRYQQQTHVSLARGAMLLWSEILAPGREAFEECFSWDYFGNELHVMSMGKLILLEKWGLTPSANPVKSLAYMGDWTHCATFIACHAGCDPAELSTLETILSELAAELSGEETVWGVSRLTQDGVLVRGFTRMGQVLPQQIEQFHSQTRLHLVGEPLIRPRKIY